MPSPKLHFKLLFGVDDYTPSKYGKPSLPNWQMLCPPPLNMLSVDAMMKLAETKPDQWRAAYRQELIDQCFTTSQQSLLEEQNLHPAMPTKPDRSTYHRKYGHELFHLFHRRPGVDYSNVDVPRCTNVAGFVIDEMRQNSPLAYAILQSYEGGISPDSDKTCGWHLIPSTPLTFDQTQEARFIRLKEINEANSKAASATPNNRFNQRIAIKQKLVEMNWNYICFPPASIEIWSVAAKYIFDWLHVKIEPSDMKMILYWERF
jgi:hypothetical protein